MLSIILYFRKKPCDFF